MSAEPMKSKFVRPSSVRVTIISEPNARISFKFWLLLPLHALGLFWIFENNSWIFYEYFSFPLTLDPMGVKSLNATLPTNRSRKFQTFFWIFFLMVLTKLRWGFSLLLLQITTKTSLSYLLNGPQKLFWVFWNFENWNCNIFFFVFVKMGAYGSAQLRWEPNFKTLLLLQIAAKCFQTCSEFFSQWCSQKCIGFFWNFELLIFNDFFIEKFAIVADGEIKNLDYVKNERS